MCLILLNRVGSEFQKEYLENGFCSHSDGAGFSYSKDKKLYTEKGFFKFDDFYEAYKKTIGNPIIVHFRFSTSGLKNKENCHPFVVSDNLHFCHNGILPYFSGRIPGCSDTFAFNENFLKPIHKDAKNKKFFQNAGFKWFLKQAIGKGNKLAFIDNKGNIEIYNEEAGEWIDKDNKEIWASNITYRERKDRKVYSGVCNPAYDDYMTNRNKEKSKTIGFGSNHDDEQMHETIDTNVEIMDRQEEEFNDDRDPVPIDIKDISKEELDEVDAYLEALNGNGN